MSKISSLPASIVTWLKTVNDLRGITFMTEFPPRAKAVPLRNSIVSVGISQVIIKDHFNDTEEPVPEDDEYCRTADITISLGIHVPASLGGSTCHEVFTKVVNHLTFDSDFNITNSVCGRITSDRNTESLVMTAEIHIDADFCPADETGIAFSSFMNKDMFCSTHLQDMVRHITSQERDLWTNYYASGVYVGSGSATKTVNLGFAPKFLIVFGIGGPPMTVDFTNQKMYYNIAVSINGSYSSDGVQTTSNGFKVLSGTNYAVGSNIPKTNDAGKTYAYFALK